MALKLLRAMGYGGREALLEQTGKSGDSALDGIVRQDALGPDLGADLDLVGVQAKRYNKDNPVQRPEIQAFVGALVPRRTGESSSPQGGSPPASFCQYVSRATPLIG